MEVIFRSDKKNSVVISCFTQLNVTSLCDCYLKEKRISNALYNGGFRVNKSKVYAHNATRWKRNTEKYSLYTN